MNIKGSVGLTTEYFCFTEVGDTSILFDLIDRNEYADWTEVTGTFETNGGTDFLIIFSQYNGITDIYLDNLRIIDENGEDMLEGAGSFCTEPALGEQTDTVLIPSLLSGDSGGFELSLPQYALTGRLKPRDEALYLNGEPAGDIAFCAFSDGTARVDYTASDGDVIAFDGVFTDNYYAKYIGPVAFRYADGKWENLLSAEGSEFYFFETLIDNYDFSGGIGGWELNSLPEGSADTLSQTAEGYDGPALLVTHSAVSGECAYKARTEAYIPVCAGETYLLRFMVRASGNMCLGASLRGNGGTAVACETSGAVITNGTDGWQWMNYRFTLPEDSSLTAVKVQLDNRFSSSDAEVAYDNIAFYRVCPKGDANGDGTSDIKDLIRYKKVMAGVGDYVSPNAADMNGNGYLNVIDMAAFQRHLLGTDDYGPVPYVAVTAPNGTAYPFNETARAYLASGGAPVEDYAVQMTDSAQDLYSQITVKSQVSMPDMNSFDLTGLQPAATVLTKAEASVSGSMKRYRPLMILAESQATNSYCRTRAEWEAATRLAASRVAEVTVVGWVDDNGDLWRPNTIVSVVDEHLKLANEMLITDVAMQLTDAGSITRLRLVDPQAYAPQPVIVEKVPPSYSRYNLK